MISIVADFDEGTVEGCLGCIGDIVPQRRHLASVYEDVLGIDLPDVPAPVEDYVIRFEPVAYNADSSFESTEVIVMHPARTITESSGFWGGSFSNVDNANGNPRLVGGFTDAEFTEEDGSEGIFWGIFTALSQPPVAQGTTRSDSPE